ncbi:MAG TPA: hypothetical protein VF062_22420 [Candidatus Limnocylindrales bacterium]
MSITITADELAEQLNQARAEAVNALRLYYATTEAPSEDDEPAAAADALALFIAELFDIGAGELRDEEPPRGPDYQFGWVDELADFRQARTADDNLPEVDR